MAKNNKKKFIIGFGVLILVIVLWNIAGSKKNKGIKVTVAEAEIRDIIETVSSSGKIYPEVEVKISSDVSGEIIEMLVNEGDTVKQGQLLCRINPELYESALSQMRASLNNSKAGMATSEAQMARVKANYIQLEAAYRRQEKLYKDKVISTAEFETAESSYLMAKAELNSAEKNVLASKYAVESAAARLEESARNYGRTSIYAPLDGMVTSLSVEKGERVVGTSQMAGTEMMRISVLDMMEIRVDVNENDIIRIKKGDSAWVEVDAYSRQRFKGVVSHVALSNKPSMGMSDNQQAVNYEVKVRILPDSYSDLIMKKKSQPFWPGMTGSVEIITHKESAILTIPVSAVLMRQKSEIEKDSVNIKKDYKVEAVFILNSDNIVSFRKVITGIQDGSHIQIIEGLEKGEKIVTGPYGIITNVLKPNQKVEPSDLETVFSGN
jgi:HlyD family secretion protein